MVVDSVLRIVAALLEAHTEVLKKASPEQVQSIIARHEARMDFWESVFNRSNQ